MIHCLKLSECGDTSEFIHCLIDALSQILALQPASRCGAMVRDVAQIDVCKMCDKMGGGVFICVQSNGGIGSGNYYLDRDDDL